MEYAVSSPMSGDFFWFIEECCGEEIGREVFRLDLQDEPGFYRVAPRKELAMGQGYGMTDHSAR